MTRVLLPSNETCDLAARHTGDPCTSQSDRPKQRYASRQMAWIAAAAYVLLINMGRGALQNPYHCPKCRFYHLTTARGERKPWARGVIAQIHAGELPA